MFIFLKIGISFLGFVVLDAIWFLCTAKSVYYPKLSHLLNPIAKPKIVYFIFLLMIYFLLSLGMCFFVYPRIKMLEHSSIIFCYAALYGLIVYGVYNFTNYITLNNWPIIIVIVDTLWGMFVCGTIGLILVKLIKSFRN